MLHTLALALAVAVAPANTVVRGLSVVPSADRTEVVIAIDGDATFRDMLISNPTRVVIDFSDARHASGLERFDNVNRGGVRNLRVAQFQPGVVRVVIELESVVQYRLERGPGEVRVSFPNQAGAFAPWSTAALRAGTAAPAVALPAATTPPPIAQPQPQPRRPITVTFLNQPLSDVLAAIGDFAGRTIIAAQDVRTRAITAEIRGQPWDLALDAILQANRLAAREHPESGIIIVEDAGQLATRRAEEPRIVRSFPIRFVNADSLRRAVEGLLSEHGRVSVNSPANALLITDVPRIIEEIGPIIAQLDVRPLQVNISATIAFIDRTALEDFGFVYDLKDSRGNQFNRIVSGFADFDGDGTLEPTSEDVILLGGASIAALANAHHRVPNPALELAISLVLGRHTLISFIEVLQSVSLTDIQAKPTIQTMNNRQAVIQVGETTPIRVVDAGSPAGPGQAARAAVDFRDTGIILRVTPYVTGDQVVLDIHAERSGLRPETADIGFTFATQLAQTQVLVNDGETAVIGGLTITERSHAVQGIPFLMDLPVIGTLFRRTLQQEVKRDLLVMVTPHIVRE